MTDQTDPLTTLREALPEIYAGAFPGEAMHRAKQALAVLESRPSAELGGGRVEAIREQLSDIVFDDEGKSVAQCLEELRRRKEIEARRDDAIRAHDLTESHAICPDGTHVVDLDNEDEDIRGSGRGDDYLEAVDQALALDVRKAPTDLHQKRTCEACGEDALCEYRDTTLVNATRPDGKGAWMCDECYEELRSQP
jgi:hypothetical protein